MSLMLKKSGKLTMRGNDRGEIRSEIERSLEMVAHASIMDSVRKR